MLRFRRLVDYAKMRLAHQRGYKDLQQEDNTQALRGAPMARLPSSSATICITASILISERSAPPSDIVSPGDSPKNLLPIVAEPRRPRSGPSVTSPTRSRPSIAVDRRDRPELPGARTARAASHETNAVLYDAVRLVARTCRLPWSALHRAATAMPRRRLGRRKGG